MNKGLIQLVRQHYNVNEATGLEAIRLLKLVADHGIQTTPASLATSMNHVKRERRGLPPIWRGRGKNAGIGVLDLLRPVQEEMARVLGFTPTLSQVVERLISVYKEKR